ncbi:uncharacterized protein Dere_GG17619 [Drosophila erecta]|uniref:Uncharacterized protein n=1 Tax=Drosophila erecta TaxID=7220 RepID=B3NTR3_DROER|nr:uncharacterized protein Dere_GG17619 [Drosophila erecta]
MGIDYVLNRQETHYDTMLVVGLTACAMGIFGLFIFIVMQLQKYQGRENTGDNRIKIAKVHVGIKKIATVYGKKHGHKYFNAPEAPGTKTLNTVMYPRPRNARRCQENICITSNSFYNSTP